VSYHRSLGEDSVAAPVPAVTLELLAKQNAEILRLQTADRMWTLLFGVAGALMSVVSLGLLQNDGRR
jgi:hypothetical protein